MVVEDVINDEYWDRQIGHRVNLIPRMLRGERLVGVLEVCNKWGEEVFTDADVETLELFASQVTISLEISRAHQTMIALVAEILESCSNLPNEQREQLRQQAFRLTGFSIEDPEYRQRMELAQLVQAIAWRGEDELRVCQKILRSFADYLA